MAATDKGVLDLTVLSTLTDADVFYVVRPSPLNDCEITFGNIKAALGIANNLSLPCLAPVNPATSAVTELSLGSSLTMHNCLIDCTFVRGLRARKQLIEVANIEGNILFNPLPYAKYPDTDDETTGISLDVRIYGGLVVLYITVDNSDTNNVTFNYKLLNYR